MDVDELEYEITNDLKDSDKTSRTCENAGNIDVLAEFDIAKPDSLDTQLLGCSIAEGDGSVIACSNIEGGLVDADCAQDGKNCQCILVIGDKPSLTSKASRLHSVKLQLSYNDVVQDSKDIEMRWDATVPTSEEPSDETTAPQNGNEEETTDEGPGPETTPTSTATTTTEKSTPPKPTLPIVIPGGGLRNGGEETAASEEKAEENRSSSTKDNTGLIVGLVFLFLICIIIIIVIAVIMWRKKQADELAAAKDAPAAAITNDVYAQPPGAGPLDNPMYGVAGGATGSGYYATNADYAASNGVYAGVGPASGGEGYLDINPDAAGAMSASNPMYFTGAPSDGLYADAQLTPNVPPGQKPPNGYVDVAPQPRAGSMSKKAEDQARTAHWRSVVANGPPTISGVGNPTYDAAGNDSIDRNRAGSLQNSMYMTTGPEPEELPENYIAGEELQGGGGAPVYDLSHNPSESTTDIYDSAAASDAGGNTVYDMAMTPSQSPYDMAR